MTSMTRRRFLGQVGRASGCLACAGVLPVGLGGCASVPWASYERTGSRITLPLSAFDDTDGVLLDLPDRPAPLYVHRAAGIDGEERFTAVLTLCMHQGCTAAPQGSRIVCPCHGSEYAQDGTLLRGPSERDLIRFPATVTDERVWIHLNGVEDG
ncbi:MAG: Rieske 2Fe-2S domain-containing protein [Gemmatimonadota bacterium]